MSKKMGEKFVTVDWEREWTVEVSESSLQEAGLFPEEGTSKFTLKKHTHNGHTSFTLHVGDGMKPLWDKKSFNLLTGGDLGPHGPHLPKHPGGAHPAKEYFDVVKALEQDMGGDIEKLRGMVKAENVEHTVTLLQAMRQLDGDEPMLIIKILPHGGPNPDGSAVGHF